MRKLRQKVLLTLWVLLAVAAAGFCAIGVRFMRYELRREMGMKSLALSRAFLIVAKDDLSAGRTSAVLDFLDAMEAFPDVEEARLLDPEGRTLAGKFRPGEAAKAFRPDPGSWRAALDSDAPVIESEATEGGRAMNIYQRVRLGKSGARTLGVCCLRLKDRTETAIAEALNLILPPVLLMTVVPTLLALYLSRRITRPLEELRAAAVEVGRGRRDLKVPSSTDDELGDLAAAFNQMVDTLSRTTVSKEYVTALLNASPLAIIALDLEARVTLWNPAAEKLFGWSAAEVAGKPYPIVAPEDMADFQNAFSVVVSGRPLKDREAVRRRRDGTGIEVGISAAPVYDANGRVVGVIAVSADLTERKALEARVLQVEKLSAVGRLAAGVAHEINNPLAVILGFAQSLVRKTPEADPLSAPLRSIEREALRCRDLVRHLLSFSRTVRPEERRPTDLNEAVREALALIATRARGQETAVLLECASSLPPVLANKNQLQQIVVNLCQNALDALGRKGQLTVRTALRRQKGRDWTVLEVQDDGPGMAPDVQKKIFEPFFTTKEVGKGTGLGLALVHEIVERHAGSIELESRPGAGSRFTIRLPA